MLAQLPHPEYESTRVMQYSSKRIIYIPMYEMTVKILRKTTVCIPSNNHIITPHYKVQTTKHT
jgi:hypothetical protein